MTKREKTATLAAITTFSIFGFSYMFSRIALSITSTQTMLIGRFDLAFLVINLVVLIVKRKKDVPEWLQFHLRGKKLLPLLLLGVLQPVVYFLCESNGVSRTNATISGVIIALVPIIGMGLGRVMLHERVKPLQIVFALVSIVGVFLMVTPGSGSINVKPLGLIFLFGAAFSGAIFHILSRKESSRYSALERTYVMMAVGAVFFTTMGLLRGVDWPAFSRPAFLWSVVYLGVLSSIAAFLLLNFANSYLTVARYTSFTNISTVLSLFAGVVFLSEPCTLLSVFASVLIIVGVIGVQKAA